MVGRSFGDGVRDAVHAAGMTQRQAAERVGWEEAKVSDLVNGKGGVTEVELALLLGLCHTPPDEVHRLLALYRESREKGYLQFVGVDALSPQRTLSAEERYANDLVVWSLNLIPGLLQIADYTRALYERSVPGADPFDIEAEIKERLARQAIFHRSREFVFYIHENALRLPVGGQDVMKEQLLHILGMSVRPYVTVRVVPVEAGAHPGAAGSFTRLKYDKLKPVISAEASRAGLFLDDDESVAYFHRVVEGLDQLAFDEEQSRRLISSLLP
ncbi:transcriptional regulator [Lentzea sp. NBRC 102530]|nr:transcriptional regulator [Lentzea sp. NBRC 102530]